MMTLALCPAIWARSKERHRSIALVVRRLPAVLAVRAAEADDNQPAILAGPAIGAGGYPPACGTPEGSPSLYACHESILGRDSDEYCFLLNNRKESLPKERQGAKRAFDSST